jgi:hypothetical protein
VSELSPEAKEAAREIFEGRVDSKTACHYCAGIHASVAGLEPVRQPCPRIKRVERHPDGSVLVVEFWEPGIWEDDVIFPSDVYEDEEER